MHQQAYRCERKFLIGRPDLHLLRQNLSGTLQRDIHDREERGYSVRSLYFDDGHQSGLFEKFSGIPIRGNYRIRIYNEDGQFMRLEKKMHKGHLSRKLSRRISENEYRQILSNDISFLCTSDDFLSHDFYQRYQNTLLRPVVIVDYRREAFVYPVENVRLTLDTKIRTGLHGIDLFDSEIALIPALEEDLSLLEMKYDRFIPSFILQLTSLSMHTPVSFSKYACCRKFMKYNDWEES